MPLTDWRCEVDDLDMQKNITHASIPAQRRHIKGIALTYGCNADLLLPFLFPPLLPPTPPVVKFKFRFTPSPRPTPVPPGPRFTAVAPGPFAIRCRLPRRPCPCVGASRRSSQSQVRCFAFEVGDGGECDEAVEVAWIFGGYAGAGGGGDDGRLRGGGRPGSWVAAAAAEVGGGEDGMCVFESERRKGCRW